MYFLTVEPKKRLTQVLRILPPGYYEEYDMSLGKVLLVKSMNPSVSLRNFFLRKRYFLLNREMLVADNPG
jgi:hypothetical protein